MCVLVELVLWDYHRVSTVYSICGWKQKNRTYVTGTTPLLRTHARITCVGVAFSLFAAAWTGESTGPPGYRVMGLSLRLSVNKLLYTSPKWKKTTWGCCMLPQQYHAWHNIPRVPCVESSCRRRIGSGNCRIIRMTPNTLPCEWRILTWLTAGLILAILMTCCICSNVKLLTPILLCHPLLNQISSAQGQVLLGKASFTDVLKFRPYLLPILDERGVMN